jgi:hypothetical protein
MFEESTTNHKNNCRVVDAYNDLRYMFIKKFQHLHKECHFDDDMHYIIKHQTSALRMNDNLRSFLYFDMDSIGIESMRVTDNKTIEFEVFFNNHHTFWLDSSMVTDEGIEELKQYFNDIHSKWTTRE